MLYTTRLELAIAGAAIAAGAFTAGLIVGNEDDGTISVAPETSVQLETK